MKKSGACESWGRGENEKLIAPRPYLWVCGRHGVPPLPKRCCRPYQGASTKQFEGAARFRGEKRKCGHVSPHTMKKLFPMLFMLFPIEPRGGLTRMLNNAIISSF